MVLIKKGVFNLKKVSMQTIADNLMLSKSVVSRALSDKYGVNEKTRALVVAEAARLGYHHKSKNLRSASPIQSILFFALRSSLEDSNYGAKVISGIEKALIKYNKRMVLTLLDNNSINPQILPAANDVEGVLILSLMPPQLLDHLYKIKLPTVFVDFVSINEADSVYADNYYGMYRGTEYILSKGHRKIIYVGSISQSYSFMQRFHGCKDCIEFHNRKSPHDIVLCSYVISDGDVKNSTFNLDELQHTFEEAGPPTAIICANDWTAFNIYSFLNEKGLRIPEDVSVLGFDDADKSSWITPSLTTIHVPMALLGQRAVELLINRIENPNSHHEEIHIKTTLVERNSIKTL